MYNIEFFNIALALFAGSGIIVLLILLTGKIVAPYGKLITNSFSNISVPARLGWFLMESPSSIIFFVFIFSLPDLSKGQIVLFFIWQSHYFYRSFIYPFLTKPKRPMPLAIFFASLLFQLVNTYFQAGWIFIISPEQYNNEYLKSWNFIFGLIIFIVGAYINRKGDIILRDLRKDGSMDYKIPYGSLYKYISCQNYFGEMIIWLGWAIMLNSWVGFTFFLWTISNLLPRAIASHQWYLKNFPDYPKDRKIVIPFIF